MTQELSNLYHRGTLYENEKQIFIASFHLHNLLIIACGYFVSTSYLEKYYAIHFYIRIIKILQKFALKVVRNCVFESLYDINIKAY